jgi:hypothetical protein
VSNKQIISLYDGPAPGSESRDLEEAVIAMGIADGKALCRELWQSAGTR